MNSILEALMSYLFFDMWKKHDDLKTFWSVCWKFLRKLSILIDRSLLLVFFMLIVCLTKCFSIKFEITGKGNKDLGFWIFICLSESGFQKIR